MNLSEYKILVVDDDPDILFATSRLLKNNGYQIITGQTGKECIEKAQTLLPDLILLDVMLPDINGIDVCKSLKKNKKTAHLSVIHISSKKIDSEDKSIGLELGADEYITRPIENRELLARVNAFLRLKKVEQELARREKLLGAIVDGIPSELYLLDKSMRIKWANRATEIALNKSSKEFIGKKCHQVCVNSDMPCMGCPAVKTFESTESEERIIEFFDNKIKNCKSIPIFDDFGKIDRVLKIETDVTAQKKAEAQLKNHQDHLEKLIDLRTNELQQQIKKREQIEKNLICQTNTLSMNNLIASSFLTSNKDNLYSNVLHVLLDVFNCPSGFFGFIDENGHLNCPSIHDNHIPNKNNSYSHTLYHQDDWNGFWADVLKKKETMICDHALTALDGISDLENVIAAPLIVDQDLVGLIGVANKPGGFNKNDKQQLEMIGQFIAPNLVMFIEKEKVGHQLQIHSKKMEEKNIALNVLLENRDENNRKISETILSNFNRLVFPYHEKIKNSDKTSDILTFLKIVESNTFESLAPLTKSVSTKYHQFTPMEIQVADLIKSGKTSQDISTLLNLSERAIYFHRNNIRKKLNIHHTKTNLRSYLLSD